MRRVSKLQQAKNGLVLATQILVAFFVFMALVFAAEVALRPGEARPSSFGSHLSPLVGWLVLAGLAIIIFRTVPIWVRGIPGLFAVGTLNAFGAIFGGKIPGGASISRGDAVILTLMIGSMTVLSGSLVKRKKMTHPDRLALLAFVYVLVLGTVLFESPRSQFLTLGASLACLLFAWMHGHGVRRAAIRRKEQNHDPIVP